MKRMPFPSDANDAKKKSLANDSAQPPWKRIGPSEQPAIFLQFVLLNGNIISYAYTDVRETRRLSAGYFQVLIMGMQSILITIEGRHLDELREQVMLHKIKAIEEVGPRSFDYPESCPSIDKITIEELTGPAGF